MAQRPGFIPTLDSTKPYLGTDSQVHADYLSQANAIAKTLEGAYGQLIGARTDARGNPLLVRTYDELREVYQAAEEIKRAIKEVKKDKGKDPWGDLVLQYVIDRFTGAFQDEYKRIKKSIDDRLKYQDQIAPYQKQASEEAKRKRTSDREGLQKLGTNLFDV